MFVLSQSATGQYVITHPPTNTIMVGDELLATFERMRTFADALGSERSPTVPPAAPASDRRWVRPALLVAVALLPFVWLGALHVSLGLLVAELRAPAAEAEGDKELRARIERLETAQSTAPPRPPRPRRPEKPAEANIEDAKEDTKAEEEEADG